MNQRRRLFSPQQTGRQNLQSQSETQGHVLSRDDTENIPISQGPEMSKVLKCPVQGCRKVFSRSTLPLDKTCMIKSDVGSWIKGKNKRKLRKKELSEFFQLVNALLNSGGGMLYLHVAANMLHFLDEQLDDLLDTLIPDDSLFGENYDRFVDDDNCHVIIRVKPGRRPLSTLDFKTKASFNKGLTDILQLKMRRLIRNKILTQQPQQPQQEQTAPKTRFGEKRSFTNTFSQGARIKGFHESKSVEAKSVKHNADKANDGRALACHAWTELKLPERITAFSKEEDGGSYFLGIGEEQTEPELAWTKVKELAGSTFQWRTAWVSKNPSEQDVEKQIFYLAREDQVPTSQDRTGHFLCEGVPLPTDQHAVMEQWLRSKINDKNEANNDGSASRDEAKTDNTTSANEAEDKAQKMFWYPRKALKNQVDILFHKVKNSSNSESGSSAGQQEAGAASDVTSGPEVYVIEVLVKPFPGLCFTDPEGPEAYRFLYPDNPEKQKTAEVVPGNWCEEDLKPLRISWATWLEEVNKTVV